MTVDAAVMPTELYSLRLVPFLGTVEECQRKLVAYKAALAESGRRHVPLRAAHVPKPGWDFNSGGEGNQQDDPLRHYLSWLWFGDEFAIQSMFAILSYLAENMDKDPNGRHTGYQNGHGQRHPNFGLAALVARERGDKALSKKMIDAEIDLYARNLGSKEWKSTGPTTFRPGCRFLSTTARLVHDVALLQNEGLIHPNQFPGLASPSAVLAKLVEWAKRWFWEMQGSGGGAGWTVAPGLYRFDVEERDWLYWGQSTSDSEEKQVTAFMHYSIFPRDVAIALEWIKDLIDEDTRRLWIRRLRDMSTWALAVAYDPVSGLSKRAQDWSPDILVRRGPFRLYASADSGERTHSIALTILASRAPVERRRRELVNALQMGMKLAPGEVDEGLAIAAAELGFGA